jgi:hypothetical protein
MKTKLILLPAVILLAGIIQLNASGLSLSNETIISANVKAPTDFSLRTHRQGKGVTATWSFAEEAVSFVIQKTYEDPNDPYAFWEDVDTVAFDNSHAFKYTDINVFAGTVNYRVLALLADGTVIQSEVSAVRINSRG